jgi:hypothetical protein
LVQGAGSVGRVVSAMLDWSRAHGGCE